jgi:hypothetical protein
MEIAGIVEAANVTNVSISDVILLNMFYELESWCTSIVA